MSSNKFLGKFEAIVIIVIIATVFLGISGTVAYRLSDNQYKTDMIVTEKSSSLVDIQGRELPQTISVSARYTNKSTRKEEYRNFVFHVSRYQHDIIPIGYTYSCDIRTSRFPIDDVVGEITWKNFQEKKQ
jgi:hypothetical protein